LRGRDEREQRRGAAEQDCQFAFHLVLPVRLSRFLASGSDE
jgi:hypothetical protein